MLITRCADEQLFLRFRDDGDVDALEQLFRRHVDELMRTAVFLAPRAGDAEDLVQTTFVSLIRNAGSYREGRRLLPWLFGILRNHARMAHREAARRAPTTAARCDRDVDPVHAALQAEVGDLVGSAIERLEEPYREVMALHLRDGMDSGEVSRRLDRSPATVRKQLSRGFEKLRRALPLSLASAAALSLSSERAVAAAVETARTAGPAPTIDDVEAAVVDAETSSRFGTLVLAGVAGVALALGFVAVFDRFGDEEAPSRAGDRDPLGSAAVAIVDGTVRHGAAPSARDVARLTDDGVPSSARLELDVTWRDGTPAAGAIVQLVPAAHEPLPLRQTGAGYRVAHADGDGRVVFDELASSGRVVVGEIGTVPSRALELEPGVVRAALPLGRPTVCRGRVVDGDGKPIASAEVWLSEWSARVERGAVVARSAADGSFSFVTGTAAPKLWARVPGRVQSPIVRPLRHGGRELRLVVGDVGRSLRVRVATRDGSRPVGGAFVAVAPQSRGTAFVPVYHERVDATGCCELRGLGREAAALVVRAPGFAPAVVDVPAGREDVAHDVRLVGGATVVGRLVDANGDGVAGVDVFAALPPRRPNEPSGPLSQQSTVTAADGRFRLTSVPAGRVLLRASRKRRLASLNQYELPFLFASHVVALREGDVVRWEPIARAVHTIRGRLASAAGDDAPLGGWTIYASPVDGASWLSQGFRTRFAETGDDGAFVVRGVDPEQRYRLTAYAPGAVDASQTFFPVAGWNAVASAAELVLRVEDASRPTEDVELRVVTPTGEPVAAAEVFLQSAWTKRRKRFVVDADAMLRVGPLPPGDYVLELRHPDWGRRFVPVALAAQGRVHALGDVAFEPPATFGVDVACGGVPQVGAQVRVTSVHGQVVARARTDARGRVELERLAPGTYNVAVHDDDCAAGTRRVVVAAGEKLRVPIELPAAAPCRLTFSFEPQDNQFLVAGPLHVVVRDAMTGRVEHEDTLASAGGGGGRRRREFASRFELSIGLPAGRHRVEATSIWGGRASIDVDVSSGVSGGPLSFDAPLRLRR